MDRDYLIERLHNQAKDLIEKMSEYYELRRIIKDDSKYCEIIYNLTNNFVKTAMIMNSHLLSSGTLINEAILNKICLTVAETTANIAEFNIKQIKESYDV